MNLVWISLLSLVSFAIADVLVGKWRRIDDLITPRSDAAIAVWNGRIYVTGGCGAHQPVTEFCSNRLSTFEEFDPATSSWRALPDLPRPRYRHGAAVVGNRLYLLGGMKGDDSGDLLPQVDIFDLLAQKWSTAPISVPPNLVASDVGVFAVNDTIFMVGGYSANYSSFDSVRLFSVNSLVWTLGAKMRRDRGDVGAVSDGTYGYVFGGWSAEDFCKPLGYLEQFYGLATNSTWIELPDCQTSSGDMAIAIMQNRLYVIGGEQKISNCSHSHAIRDVWAFDLANNTWSPRRSLVAGLFRGAATTVGDAIYVFGGQADPEDGTYNVMSAVWKYTEEVDPQPDPTVPATTHTAAPTTLATTKSTASTVQSRWWCFALLLPMLPHLPFF